MINDITILATIYWKHCKMKTAADGKIIHYHFDSEHKWQSPLLIFVIARIGLSVQNTNLHLKEGLGTKLGTKLNVIKSQI